MIKIESRAEILPKIVTLLPLFGAVLLPNAQIPLSFSEREYSLVLLPAIKECGFVGIIQPSFDNYNDGPIPLFKIGCLARLEKVKKLENGSYFCIFNGICRFEILEEVEESQDSEFIHEDFILEPRRAFVSYNRYLFDFDQKIPFFEKKITETEKSESNFSKKVYTLSPEILEEKVLDVFRSFDIGTAFQAKKEENGDIENLINQKILEELSFKKDFLPDNNSLDRKRLLKAIQKYVKTFNIPLKMDDIFEISDSRLITLLTMFCSLEAQERQALLELPSIKEQAELITTLMEI